MWVFMIPLVVFLVVVLVVAIVKIAKLRDREVEAHRFLHAAQLEHQRRMMGLQQELEQVRRGG